MAFLPWGLNDCWRPSSKRIQPGQAHPVPCAGDGTMLRIIPAAAGSAIGFALLVAAPLSAQHVEHITPAEQVTLAAWTGGMNVMLDREISRSSAIWSKVANEGVVRVKFNCSENGRPDKVTLLKGSGNAALDAQAL